MDNTSSTRLLRLQWGALAAYEAALIFLYARLRLLNSFSITEPRISFGDTTDYLLIASQSLLSPKFWLADKPFIIPLFFKLLSRDPQRIFTVQLWLSIVCWSVLAVAFALLLRSYPLKFLASAVVLGFSLSQQIILWDPLLLTESLSFSLGALFYASGLWLSRRWTPLNAAIFLLLAVLLAFIRDSNAYMFLMAGVALLVVILLFKAARLRLLLISATFGAVFVVSSLLGSAGHHGGAALLNVLVGRILPKAEYKAFMAAQGMPVKFTPVPQGGNPYDWFALQGPEMADLRAWASAHGKSALLKFYWHFKADTLQHPLDDPAAVMAPDLYYYSATGFKRILESTRFAELLYPMRFGVIAFWLANLLAAFLAAIAILHRKLLWLMPLLMILLSYLQIVFVWNTDPHDIWRHALPLNVQWRLGLWFLAFLIADDGIPWLAQRLTISGFGRFARPSSNPDLGLKQEL